jgi:penicillin-binding protein 1A
MEVENRYPADDFVMPEGIVMRDGLAFRSDMPIEGASATAPSTGDDSVVDTSQGGEDLMRQMF